VFPTTVWTDIARAGARDKDALEAFAQRYRAPVLEFIRRRGLADAEAEDACQDAFVRVLHGDVLSRADAGRGRFRALLLTVVRRTLLDRVRRDSRNPELPLEQEPASHERDPDFDRAWVLHLAERAMSALRDEGSSYYPILQGHLAGEAQDRQKLWIARKKLIAKIRHEVALTCASHEEFEEEVAYLSQFLER
jgi:RNA polymerase sigma factor (sigma-70 family)